MKLGRRVAAAIIACVAVGATAACGHQQSAGTALPPPVPSSSATPSVITVAEDMGPVSSTTAYAQAAGDESITSFVVDDRIDAKGVLHVTETIAYDFGTKQRHGIYRDLVVREPDRADPSKAVVFGVSDVHVSAVGASSALSTSTVSDGANRELRLKIGDSNRTVTGLHRYTIRYDVTGALTARNGNPELDWNVTGDGWSVPIDEVRVAVTAPGGVKHAVCFAGEAGSTTQCAATAGANVATYRQRHLMPHLGLTVAASLQRGAVAVRSR